MTRRVKVRHSLTNTLLIPPHIPHLEEMLNIQILLSYHPAQWCDDDDVVTGSSCQTNTNQASGTKQFYQMNWTEHYNVAALYVLLSKSKRLRSLRSQICLYGPNQTMSSQDSLTGLLPIPGQLKDSPARELSSVIVCYLMMAGREGHSLELFCSHYSSLC